MSCPVCHGNPRICRPEVCPNVLKFKLWKQVARSLDRTTIFGASPPSAFVGEWGYPKVLAGPLVPPVAGEDTSIMDACELWIDKGFDALLQYRLSLLRGKKRIDVREARDPSRSLTVVQELVMASESLDTEMWLDKRPNLRALFLPRSAPVGVSAPFSKISLSENPRVALPVEKVVYDADLGAAPGILTLYRAGIPQSHITRIFSVGLLGEKKKRRLVPTEWSITAVDDIIGKALWREVLQYDEIDHYQLFGETALGNNVQILLLPSPWMYEVLEVCPFASLPHPPTVFSDYELSQGRKTYPTNIAGAYHATRLPILEYLGRSRRQAGAIAFLEVYPEWVPLGVWRYREIARTAFRKAPSKFETMEEGLHELSNRLKHPFNEYLKTSKLLKYHREQKRIERFIP